MSRMQLLEDALQTTVEYEKHEGERRSGILDLLAFDIMLHLHIQDENDYIWSDTPDHLMEIFIASGHYFTIQFGYDDLEEQIADWLIINKYIKERDEE